MFDAILSATVLARPLHLDLAGHALFSQFRSILSVCLGCTEYTYSWTTFPAVLANTAFEFLFVMLAL